MEWLKRFREEIDSIDSNLMELLLKRFEVVTKVWEYKKEHNLPPLQPGRWKDVLSDKISKAEKIWLDTKMIENIWNSIHEWALKLEDEVKSN